MGEFKHGVEQNKEPTGQERTEDRYFRALAKGLAEILAAVKNGSN